MSQRSWLKSFSEQEIFVLYNVLVLSTPLLSEYLPPMVLQPELIERDLSSKLSDIGVFEASRYFFSIHCYTARVKSE